MIAVVRTREVTMDDDRSDSPATTTMTLDEYIAVFRGELADLHWEERRDLNGVLSRRNVREIFRVMEELREAKKVTTARFERALTDFWGQFC